MKWLKTGKQIGQAVKNVQRLRQIVAVFAKHGFADVFQRMNLGKFLPSRFSGVGSDTQEHTIPERLRLSFEELGPTFVKLGQVLSTRPDLLPESYIDEMTKLQDNVQQVPFRVIKNSIESELKKPLHEAFKTFDEEPLASASIAQVHAAELNSGEKVVVKVQRKGLKKAIETDISLLAFLAKLLEKYVPETRIASPSIIVDEFFRTLSYETDFVVEANNMSKMRENMVSIPEIVIPKVYRELSTSKILTLERLNGIRVNDIDAIDREGIDKKHVVEIGAKSFFKSIMMDGLFHGDLHGGNLFVLPGNKLGVIDFGMVGRLSQKSRDQLANMVMSLLTEDFENLCYQYAELGMVGSSVDFDGFQREIRNTLSPYLGLSLKDLNAGKILIEATKIATKYDIKVPGDWMLVFKAILTVEGMGRTLDPDFDLMSVGQEMVSELVKEQYSMQRLSKDLMWVAKDVSSLLQVLPRQIRWMFRKFNSNDFAFEIKIPELEDVQKELHAGSKTKSLGTISAGLFVAAGLALQYGAENQLFGYPAVAVVFFAIALVLLLRILFS